MGKLEVEELLLRCEEALVLAEESTPGPWKMFAMSIYHDHTGTSILSENESRLTAHTFDPDRGLRTYNGNFICHARSYYAILARALKERLEAEK